MAEFEEIEVHDPGVREYVFCEGVAYNKDWHGCVFFEGQIWHRAG